MFQVYSEYEFVYFKVNGLTLKNKDGSVLKAKVINATATVKYTVPIAIICVTDGKSMTPKNHSILAGYANKNYLPTAINTSTFQVEKSNITILFDKVVINNKTHKLSINAPVKDYLNNTVKEST